MRYTPLADRVLVRPAEENRATRTGLVVPDAVIMNKHIAFGTVIAIGTGRTMLDGTTAPLILKVGDVVCYPRKAPGILPILQDDGSEELVLMLREAEVIAVVHDMPQPSRIVDVAGAPLSMVPTSRAMPDSAAANRDAFDRAVHAGFVTDEENAAEVDEPNGFTG